MRAKRRAACAHVREASINGNGLTPEERRTITQSRRNGIGARASIGVVYVQCPMARSVWRLTVIADVGWFISYVSCCGHTSHLPSRRIGLLHTDCNIKWNPDFTNVEPTGALHRFRQYRGDGCSRLTEYADSRSNLLTIPNTCLPAARQAR